MMIWGISINNPTLLHKSHVVYQRLKARERFAWQQRVWCFLFHELSHAFDYDNDKTNIPMDELIGGHAKPEDVYDENKPKRWFLDPDMTAAVILHQLSKIDESNAG